MPTRSYLKKQKVILCVVGLWHGENRINSLPCFCGVAMHRNDVLSQLSITFIPSVLLTASPSSDVSVCISLILRVNYLAAQ